MKAEVGFGMRFGVVGDFGEPGTGNHDAGGGGSVLVEGVEASDVFRVGDGEVVGVDDEEFGIARIAQAFGESFCLGWGVGRMRGEVQMQDSSFA